MSSALLAGPRRRLNLSIPETLIREARAAKLNLSRFLEEKLAETLRAERARQWLEENKEALAYHRDRIERDGLWHKGLTPWY